MPASRIEGGGRASLCPAGDDAIQALSVSASRNQEGRIHITLTNLDPNQARTVETVFRGEDVSQVEGRILTASAMNAHNTFE